MYCSSYEKLNKRATVVVRAIMEACINFCSYSSRIKDTSIWEFGGTDERSKRDQWRNWIKREDSERYNPRMILTIEICTIPMFNNNCFQYY